MGSPQYCSIQDLKDAVDIRDLKGLLSDDGTEASIDSSNTKLVSAIEYASSEFLRSVLAGKKYTAAEILTLVGDDDWAVRGPVADIAIWFIYSRRQSTDIPTAVAERHSAAQEVLKSLRKGEQILPVETSVDSEMPEAVFSTQHERERLDLVSDSPYFNEERYHGDT